MKIKWKNKNSLKPQVILDKIENAKIISNDGGVSYSAFEYHDAFAALFSMIEFPKVVEDELDIDSIVENGLRESVKLGVLTKELFIEKLNDTVRTGLATKEHKYHLLTSLSISGDLPFKKLDFERTSIRFIDKYPKKYSCRSKIINGIGRKFSDDHEGYKKVIITTKAKSLQGASSKAIKSLDILRALLCIFSNSGMELLGNRHSPINRVRTGEVHTLHKDNGLSATKNTIWFEPNFVTARPFVPENALAFRENLNWSIKQLSQCPYQDALKDGLLRYVRALDESNHNSALIQIWGALESIAAPSESSYDSVIKRCSFIFEESKYHQQILEHLREFRNKSIHAGYQSDRAKTFCFQLQFYFRKLMLFHLKNVGEFTDLAQANNFLDLPTDANAIRERKRLLLKAVTFRDINN